MKKNLMFLILSTASLLAYAGESTISGTGRVTAPSDFIQLVVRVQAECFAKPSEAVRSANELAKKVNDLLLTAKSQDSNDGVFTNGGFATEFSKTVYVNEGGQRQAKTVCVNTFQASTTLTLKTSDVSGFASRFAVIQEGIYSDEFQKPTSDAKDPATYAVMGQPSPQWSLETRESLTLEASEKAILDAQRKMAVYAENACIYEWDMVDISSVGLVSNVPYAAERAGLAPAAAVSSGPTVNFDQQWVSESIVVTFSWIGGAQTQACALK